MERQLTDIAQVSLKCCQHGIAVRHRGHLLLTDRVYRQRSADFHWRCRAGLGGDWRLIPTFGYYPEEDGS
jgi:hypothetical protein